MRTILDDLIWAVDGFLYCLQALRGRLWPEREEGLADTRAMMTRGAA